MFLKKSMLLSASVASLFAGPVFAGLTEQDVWSDMLMRAGKTGGMMIAGSTDGTVYKDVSYFFREDGVEIDVDMGAISFLPEANGDVIVQFPQEMAGTVLKEDISGDFIIINDGLEMRASGEPGNITYDYAADGITVDFNAVSVENGEEGSLRVKAGAENLYGSTVTIDEGDHVHVASFTKADRMDLEFSAVMPLEETTDSVSGEISIEGFDGEYAAEFSGEARELFMSPTENSDLIDGIDGFKGVSISQDVKYSDMKFSVTDGGQEGNIFDYATGPGKVELLLNESGLDYDAEVARVRVSLTPAMMRMPVEATIDSVASRFLVPFAPEEFSPNQTSPMEIGIDVSGLDVGAKAWGLIDPMGMFDHAPISFRADVSGEMNWGEAEEFNQYDVAIPDSIEVKDVTFDGLGVSAHVAGNVIFSGDPSSNFDGMPEPEGEMKVSLKGFEGLLKRLSQAGMADPGMLFMANGMLETYTVPVGDYRNADIVFDGKGGMKVNDVPLIQ